MKIHPLQPNTGYTPIVRERSGDDSACDDHSSPQSDQKESRKREVTPEELDQERLDFQAELQTQAEGLSTSVEGSGPGLRVVLKDAQGEMVRQMTGEEFLRLRQAAQEEGRVVGKILDLKL